jgi:DNA-binding MarR family transcriptional regulator
LPPGRIREIDGLPQIILLLIRHYQDLPGLDFCPAVGNSALRNYMGAHRSARLHEDVRTVLDSIRRILRALRLFDREAEKRAGLSGAQLFVLRKLGEQGTGRNGSAGIASESGTGISINELAERVRTDQSSVSVIVQKLAARGLLRRKRGSPDGRRIELTLTGKGRSLLRKSPAAAQERLIAAIGQMIPARRRALARLLVELVEKTGIDRQPATLFFEDAASKRHRKKAIR